jgi:hypothetical protein
MAGIRKFAELAGDNIDRALFVEYVIAHYRGDSEAIEQFWRPLMRRLLRTTEVDGNLAAAERYGIVLVAELLGVPAALRGQLE